MNEKKEMITVLLTVYNRLSVKATIDSILNQTFKDYQLLIIDNASDDGTYELLCKYENTDNRVKVVRNEKNMGQTYSLHLGMSIAKGKYIARIDADDLMHKDRLKEQFEFMESHQEFGFCGSFVQYITDDNKLAFVVKMPVTDIGMRVVQRISCAMYHPAAMMRKETLDKYHITYDKELKMAEDYDMWRKLLDVSKGCNLPQILTYYRRGNTSDSNTHRQTTREEELRVRKKTCCDEFPGKKEITTILNIEQHEKKGIIDTIKAMILYKRYIKLNLSKEEEDYNIAIERAKSRFIGEFIVYNNSLLAKLSNRIYQSIKAYKYLIAK